MACAAASRLENAGTSARFSMVMPPGAGKSRVIFALILLV